MIEDLIFQDTCTIYPTTVDDYGSEILGTPATVACLYEQTTAYQHGNSQDAIVGTPRLTLPSTDPFVLAHHYRLEEMVVQINPFGEDSSAQWFKITSASPARDTLLFNEVRHVECDLKKVKAETYVS